MIAVPMTRDFLSSLVPQLGSVSVVTFPQEGVKAIATPKKRSASLVANGAPVQVPVGQVPPAVGSWDLEVLWASPTQISDFDSPGSQMPALFSVRTRISAVGRVLLSQKADWDSNWALILIYAFGILFLVIEIVALIVGVSLTRSITNTVHDLYEGTERVKEGDFSHRIRLKGRDQLAQLGASFNGMTERVEQLLQVAKEKERYEAELEIAREIQKQLYPRQVPASPKLKLTALYKPARMVSGDYYDYQRLDSDQLVLALGDVAGKGISAALLMATIQSSFRTQIKTAMEQAAVAAKAAGSVPVCNLSTSQLTSLLNQHLYSNTPPEKFATFVFGVFDEKTSILHYTNAGHLQPILIRRGEASLLEVDGMVIGAFPFARYGESQIAMEPGDLLVFYTDGISEPENEYGEMYGEQRLTELLLKNAGKSDQEILEMIIDAVERWTGSPELQDDMTLLVARCL
jgi:sigma-B regulation protein RsbU (phosphoserine phosphatase)